MKEFRYQVLSKQLTQGIKSGRWKSGERLPSVRELCLSQSLSKATVLHALHQLEAEGLLEARPKSGYFVKAAKQHKQRPPQPSLSKPTPQSVNVPTLFRDIMKHSAAFDILPGAGGNEASSHIIELNRHISRAMRNHPENKAMYYNEPAGDLALRSQITERYRQFDLSINPDQFCITSGCQNALFLALMTTCKPGDNVIVESPAFYGVLQLLEQLQLNVIEVPASAETGLDINAFESTLKTWQVTACVVTPAFATPTGATIPDQNKARLMTLADHYDIAVIEDDIYGDLFFGTRPTPLKALDSQERVILCSSFSKALSRDLRIGWISGGRWHEKITQLKLVTHLASSQSLQQGLASFMAEGCYRRHLGHYRQRLKQQRDQLVGVIRDYWPNSTLFSVPEGGLALWLEMDSSLNMQAAYLRALEKSIILTPGSLFSATGQYQNYLRLSFTHPITGARKKALQTLAAIVLTTE